MYGIFTGSFDIIISRKFSNALGFADFVTTICGDLWVYLRHLCKCHCKPVTRLLALKPGADFSVDTANVFYGKSLKYKPTSSML